MCMCIPPSKTQRDTNPTPDFVWTSAPVGKTCWRPAVLILGRREASRNQIAPWWGLGFCSVSWLLLSAQKAAYSATLSRGYLQRQEWENYGPIHANAKRQHQIPSNDGLEFFYDNTPEQNPIVHQKHIFIKIIVISRFFKSRNSYA